MFIIGPREGRNMMILGQFPHIDPVGISRLAGYRGKAVAAA